jgi:hypothetical protein
MMHLPRATYLLLTLLVLASVASAQAPPPDEIVCPRTAKPPAIDGSLADACWQGVPQVAGFAVPSSIARAAKRVQVRACFGGSALHLAFTCEEPRPDKVRALAADGSRSVRQDDCVEVFLRTGESVLDFDQFIVNASGARQGGSARGLAASRRTTLRAGRRPDGRARGSGWSRWRFPSPPSACPLRGPG